MTIASPAITGLRRLLDGLLLALVAVTLGVIVLGRVLPLTGHQTLVVGGPSMEPSIPIGAAVVLDQVEPASLAVGDVVSLRSGPQRAIFTHRIIRLAELDGARLIETQGDANPAPDPSLTPATAVLGRVAVSIPYAGYLLALYSAPSGILFVLSLGLVLIVAGMMLEPRTTRPIGATAPELATASESRPTAAPSAASVPVFERSSVKEVVAASRERRVRRARLATNGARPRRPEPEA